MLTLPDLDRLKRERPEWEPWLLLVEETLRETASPEWQNAVPALASDRPPDAPLLARTTVTVDATALRRLLRQFLRVTPRDAAPTLARLEAVLDPGVNVAALFAASLTHDAAPIDAVAASHGIDREPLHAVVALLSVPFLQACHRRWEAAIGESWVHGHCPLCGSWPTLAEVRGIERSRHLRCGRCGAAWHAHALSCPFCSSSDHHDFVALVPAARSATGTVEACTRCAGYIKTFTRLQGCPANAVMLEDLASVDLDLAALEHGCARPEGTGPHVDVTVVQRITRRFFGWNRA